MTSVPASTPEGRRISRRQFLVAAGGVLLTAGCQRRSTTGPAAGTNGASNHALPVNDIQSTILNPSQAAVAPRLTQHPVRFTDVTRAAGIDWSYQNGATGRHLFVETTGGGVALFDYNNDGLLDIFAVQGGPVPGAPASERHFPTRSVLYRNNGDGTFTDVTNESGLEHISGYGQGVSAADFDNDGWVDLFVTTYGGNHLFRNLGNGKFEEVTERAGLSDVSTPAPWPLSSAWGDYDNDGRLDLFVCHYAHWSLDINKNCPRSDGKLAYCRPQVYEGSHCRLYHNEGNGVFKEVSEESGISRLYGKSMGAIWVDYDGDGWMDLFVTNDTLPNFMLHNNRDGTFTDRGLISGVGVGPSGDPMSGMGIGVGDYDHDGREDLFVVNFAGEPKSVFHNLGHGMFENDSYQTNIAATDLQFLGFGLECFDYDLDGYRDLLFGNGHVLDNPDVLSNGATYAQSQQLFHNQRGTTFAEDRRSLGDLVKPRVTRGLAVGDIDNDGDIDVVAVAQNGPMQLFRNDGGNRNHWITFRLEGVKSNRDAIGARVTIYARNGNQMASIHGGGSYCSQSDLRLTFGLADADRVEAIEIRWPGGLKQRLPGLTANRFYWIREGGQAAPDPRVATHDSTAHESTA